MTFDEIVSSVADELNLTSASAIARIGRNVNKRYRQISSSLGINTISRQSISAVTTVGSQFLVFGPRVEKLETVLNPTFTPWQPLFELTVPEIRMAILGTDPAVHYAIYGTTSNTVTLLLDAVCQAPYTLMADAFVNLATMMGAESPRLPESFHDVLEYGPRAIELRKMEKTDEAEEAEQMFEKRLNEMRYFIAKSGWLMRYQAKDAPTSLVTTTVPVL